MIAEKVAQCMVALNYKWRRRGRKEQAESMPAVASPDLLGVIQDDKDAIVTKTNLVTQVVLWSSLPIP